MTRRDRLTAALAALTRNDKHGRCLLVVAAICLGAADLIRRFGNQPINAVVMTWNPQAPAANWTELRDTWWRWHILRTVAGVAALSLALLAAPGGQRSPSNVVQPNPLHRGDVLQQALPPGRERIAGCRRASLRHSTGLGYDPVFVRPTRPDSGIMAPGRAIVRRSPWHRRQNRC